MVTEGQRSVAIVSAAGIHIYFNDRPVGATKEVTISFPTSERNLPVVETFDIKFRPSYDFLAEMRRAKERERITQRILEKHNVRASGPVANRYGSRSDSRSNQRTKTKARTKE